MNSIDEILAIPKDSDLCDRLFVRIAEKTDNRVSATGLSVSEETVLLVWHSYGIIGNGGFHYLLEGDFDGDPGFRKTAAAYDRINCRPAAEVFNRLFAGFPKGQMSADIDERLETYESEFGGILNDLDKTFFSASNEIESKLAAFIRKNAASFDC